jgi:NTP pyrophosphatase (non-canonical NTP hydrolase)
MNMNELMELATENAHKHGWKVGWRNLPKYLMLAVTECSEAMDAWRDDMRGISYDEHGKPVGIPTEMADIMIRVAHYCKDLNIDLEEALRIKMEYNKTRPFKHGRKRI